MIDFAKHRAKIAARVAAAKQMKFEPAKPVDECQHEWQKFKETIQPSERTYEQSQLGMDYRRGPAYFIVRACTECHKKERLDYVITN